MLVLTVSDNGKGGARVGAGSGLIGLQHRVAAVDGRLAVQSLPGGPTQVTVWLPWTQARPTPTTAETPSTATEPRSTS
jgi:signal transduction histidine kinase